MTSEMKQNTPFSSLLITIGEKLETEQAQWIKHLLKGHINRETLQNLTTGQQLTKTLYERGLVTEKKLAFLRKLLVEAKSWRLVDLLDTYKSYNSTSGKPGGLFIIWILSVTSLSCEYLITVDNDSAQSSYSLASLILNKWMESIYDQK